MPHTKPKETYTLGHGKDATASHAARTAETDAAFLLPRLQPHFRILDVGCGPGTITTSFCRYVPEGEVVGIDYSPQVLIEANERADATQPSRPKNLKFYCIDVLSTSPSTPASSLSDTSSSSIPSEWHGTFDVIFESQCFVHIPDPIEAIKRLKPLLRPGSGMFAMRDYDCGTMIYNPDPSGHLERWGPFQGQISGGKSHWGGRDLHIWARKAGFDREKIELASHGVVHRGPEKRKWWGELNAARFSEGQSLRKAMEEKGGLTAQECEDIKAAILKWKDDPDGIWAATAFEVIAKV